MPGDGLVGPAHAHVARPDREAELAELVEVAHRRVHEQGGDAAALRLRREQLADERDRRRLGHRQHEHLAGLGLGYRSVHHQVVVLAAADGARGAGGARAREHLVERHVDERSPPRRLVDGGAPEPGELGVGVRHRASTTCGVTRWNASAKRIAALPEERRAWFARCSARCA